MVFQKDFLFNFLRTFYRKIIPSGIRAQRWDRVHKRKQYNFNMNFLKYMDKNFDSLVDEEINIIYSIRNDPYIELTEKCKRIHTEQKFIKLLKKRHDSDNEKIAIIDFLRKNGVSMLPYTFIKKYNRNDIIVYTDNNDKYVLHENKRMYFPENWKDEKIQEYYNNLLQEQDIDSPHRYEYGDFQVKNGDIVADIGASEGFFALSVIEKVKKIYLFECDEIWMDTLRKTFLPWKEKIVIVNKFVSDHADGNFITLDKYFEEEVNFIKADIEGAEIQLLKGSRKILKYQKNLKIVLCTYHNKYDARYVKQVLLKNNFHVEFSKGYIISVWEKRFSLRKGVIRGHKQKMEYLTKNHKKGKINLLYDAAMLFNPQKGAIRSGAFFVSYNILKEIARRPVFNIILFVRYEHLRYIRKIKKDTFLSAFSLFIVPEKDLFLYNINVHRQKINETHNFFIIMFTLLKIIKNYLKIFFFEITATTKKAVKLLDAIDIFFSPLYAVPDIIINSKNIKRFIILHDTIPLQSKNINDSLWFKNIVQTLDPQTYCFCVSECTKNDFLKAIPAQLDRQKMFVTYNASAQQFTPDYDKEKLSKVLKKYNIQPTENNYVFSLCSIDPRKNLLFTTACFIKFIQKHNIQNLCFYLGGGHFESFIAQFNEKMKEFSAYGDKIIRLGYVDDEDVNILYSNSLFFTYLSQYEGFGMPPLEAMQAGTPVITSNNSSLPEVVGDAAIMIDYDNEEQCIKAFEDLYFNENLRKHYIAKGIERAKLFSWEKTTQEMTEIMLDNL